MCMTSASEAHWKQFTGSSKILRELKKNGSPAPVLKTDADRTYRINDREVFMKSIDYSYYYEQEDEIVEDVGE